MPSTFGRNHAARRGIFYGWWVVAACFVVAAFSWGLGLFGSSVYLQAVTSAHGWAASEVSSAVTLSFLISAAVQRPVGRSIDRWGSRPVLSLGAVAMGLSVALIGQVTAPWQLYLCFALLGCGWSMLSVTGIAATVAPWFERHQGRSMTLAIMGASVGAIAGVPLLLMALSSLGLARGLVVTGAVAVACLLPLIWLVLRYRGPGDLDLSRDGVPLDGVAATPTEGPSRVGNGARVLLWSTAVAFALALTVQIGFITHHVALAAPQLGLAAGGWLVSATGVTALIGRVVLAAIADRVDVRRLACLVIAAQSVALAALSLWPSIPVLIAASLIYGYGIGHVTTLAPVIVRREFGAGAFGATYGSAATVILFTSAFGPMAFGLLRDVFGGYAHVLGIAASTTLIACTVLFVGGRAAAARSSSATRQ